MNAFNLLLRAHKTGRVVISNAKRYRAVLNMIENLFQYYLKAENPKRLVRRIKEKKDASNNSR